MAHHLTWSDAPDLLTPLEVAHLLRISRSNCYESLRSGTLRPLAIRLGRHILVSKHALQRLIEGDGEATGDVKEAS